MWLGGVTVRTLDLWSDRYKWLLPGWWLSADR